MRQTLNITNVRCEPAELLSYEAPGDTFLEPLSLCPFPPFIADKRIQHYVSTDSVRQCSRQFVTGFPVNRANLCAHDFWIPVRPCLLTALASSCTEARAVCRGAGRSDKQHCQLPAMSHYINPVPVLTCDWQSYPDPCDGILSGQYWVSSRSSLLTLGKLIDNRSTGTASLLCVALNMQESANC